VRDLKIMICNVVVVVNEDHVVALILDIRQIANSPI
jgi:hypothetical protein